ncbi:hypothetical protein [Pseudomonas putida]|uniref:hypothetical protein n=1 Tax=Pseudomonas putida TaxID=303 RepID=UPI003D9979CE
MKKLLLNSPKAHAASQSEGVFIAVPDCIDLPDREGPLRSRWLERYEWESDIMASDGRKRPLPAWSHRVPGRAKADPFPAPDVSRVTLPGNPSGLFPRPSLDADIELKVPAWSNTPTDPLDKEYITAQAARPGTSNYEDVSDEVEFIPGTTPIPVTVKLLSTWLLKDENEGPFNLRYRHVNYLGTPSNSTHTPVFVDKVPPNGTAAPRKLTLGFTPPIVDATLEGITDLEATVPEWTGAAEGDKVAFTVERDKLPEDPNDIVPIDVVTLGPDRKIKFPVSLLKSLPDGSYCFGYRVYDKALNPSRICLYDLIQLALGAFPIPPFPVVSVAEAEDDGVVNRADALRGVHVEFAKILNAKSTDMIAIIWGAKSCLTGHPWVPILQTR